MTEATYKTLKADIYGFVCQCTGSNNHAAESAGYADVYDLLMSDADHLRMKYFLKHGTVSVWDKVSASGNERVGHKVDVGNEMIAHSDLLEQKFSLIRSAVKGKSVIQDKPPRYGQRWRLNKVS